MHSNKDLKQKIVIDIHTAEGMGKVLDIDVDLGTGRINSIILPSREPFFGLFSKNKEYVVPWECIKAIGNEYILVDFCLLSKLLP